LIFGNGGPFRWGFKPRRGKKTSRGLSLNESKTRGLPWNSSPQHGHTLGVAEERGGEGGEKNKPECVVKPGRLAQGQKSKETSGQETWGHRPPGNEKKKKKGGGGKEGCRWLESPL